MGFISPTDADGVRLTTWLAADMSSTVLKTGLFTPPMTCSSSASVKIEIWLFIVRAGFAMSHIDR